MCWRSKVGKPKPELAIEKVLSAPTILGLESRTRPRAPGDARAAVRRGSRLQRRNDHRRDPGARAERPFGLRDRSPRRLLARRHRRDPRSDAKFRAEGYPPP